MNGVFRISLVSLLLFLGTRAAQADPFLSLSADAPDLNSLTLGQSFNVRVSLGGLNTGDSLDYLAATVTFDGNVLGTPTITVGPIVPDSTGFVSSALSGLAD